jgi:hypothetical protein
MGATDTDEKDRSDQRGEAPEQQGDSRPQSGENGQESFEKKRDGRRDRGRGRAKRRRRAVNLDSIEKGVVQLAALTGREPESVLGVTRVDDGWELTVEVVELERIPPSTNLTATYEAELDEDGNLVSYRRSGGDHRKPAAAE